MSITKERNTLVIERPLKKETICFHCGTPCGNENIHLAEKLFCCEGCKLVYEILNTHDLCDYYKIQSHPGLGQIKPARNEKYAYLDDQSIAAQLYKFTDGIHAIVTLYIPGVHCSSCMWLLEHLPKLDAGISESRLNFTSKEVTIHFLPEKTSLRKIVELLTTIGYEPFISLDDAGKKKTKQISRKRIYTLGIAGFCFGNIMMLSFPEYLSGKVQLEKEYASLFRYLILGLSLPVFFYAASEFFITAWAGLRQRILNIDAPIALAILITFTRSLYEILSGTGPGYMDSMSGIVFFMLVGRLVQERSYQSISFHRDYQSYFPIAVNVVTNNGVETRKITELKEKDIVQLFHDDIIPADAILLDGNACIDYSFVTGESEPVPVLSGAMVYAGGRQSGEQIRLQIIKPVAGSYLTSLWNHYVFSKDKVAREKNKSIIPVLSKYFTLVLFSLAILTALYWSIADPSKILPAVSAMLIVACPCALLLSATYTNGNLLRIFSNNGLFLRDASIIEDLGKSDHIVFDKTGTLTEAGNHFTTEGHKLTEQEKDLVYSAVSSSKHPYSKALISVLGTRKLMEMDSWKEITGSGIEAEKDGSIVRIGSSSFTVAPGFQDIQAQVYVRINEHVTAYHFLSGFRNGIPQIISELKKQYSISLLSGDNNRQERVLKDIFGQESQLLFEQKPIDKLESIESLQENGKHVVMIGDGLNDAGALQQSDVGITLADDINNFTPSCDAILDASRFNYLPPLIKLAKAASKIIHLSFAVSILYNIIGLTISMQGKMSPMIAAILMPVSTLSIVMITTGASSLWAKKLGLSLRTL